MKARVKGRQGGMEGKSSKTQEADGGRQERGRDVLVLQQKGERGRDGAGKQLN